MQKAKLRNAIIIAVVSLCAITGLFLVTGETCGKLLLPLYRSEIKAIYPFIHIKELLIETTGRDRLITLRAVFNAPQYIGMSRLDIGTTISSSTLLGHALLPFMVMLPLVSAARAILPVSNKRLVLGTLFFLALLTALDVPFVLVGAMEDILQNQFAPGNSPSLMMRWLYFLNGGGRLGLSVAAAIITVSYSSSLSADHVPRQSCLLSAIK